MLSIMSRSRIRFFSRVALNTSHKKFELCTFLCVDAPYDLLNSSLKTVSHAYAYGVHACHGDGAYDLLLACKGRVHVEGEEWSHTTKVGDIKGEVCPGISFMWEALAKGVPLDGVEVMEKRMFNRAEVGEDGVTEGSVMGFGDGKDADV